MTRDVQNAIANLLEDRSRCEFWGNHSPHSPQRKIVFPGSFDPLHDGHRAMAKHACQHFREDVEFEISIKNVDKPDLIRSQIEKRLGQFRPDQIVWITRAPTFLEKARLFPGSKFIVGADTILRIANPIYYGSEEEFNRAIAEVRELECQFVLFGRLVENDFLNHGNVQISKELLQITLEIPGLEFRMDVSSTSLRERDARHDGFDCPK